MGHLVVGARKAQRLKREMKRITFLYIIKYKLRCFQNDQENEMGFQRERENRETQPGVKTGILYG